MLQFYFTPIAGNQQLLTWQHKPNNKVPMDWKILLNSFPQCYLGPRCELSQAAQHQAGVVNCRAIQPWQPPVPQPAASMCLMSCRVTCPQNNYIPWYKSHQFHNPRGVQNEPSLWQLPQLGEAIPHCQASGLKFKQQLQQLLATLASTGRWEMLQQSPTCHPGAKEAEDPG